MLGRKELAGSTLDMEESLNSISEKELVERAIRGDQTAYRMIYQIHERAVRGRVSGYFKWKADVDDSATSCTPPTRVPGRPPRNW